MRRIGAGLLAGAIALSACTGGETAEAPTPSATASAESPSPSPSPTPTASSASPSEIDVTTVPDQITAEYIQAVLDELAEIQAEATRTATTVEPYPATAEELPIPIVAHLAQGFKGTRLELARQLVFLDASPNAEDPLLPNFKPYQYSVQGAPEMVGQCLAVEVVTDLSETLDLPPPSPDQPIDVLLLQEHESTFEENPTPWVIVDSASPDGGFPLEDAVERSC